MRGTLEERFWAKVDKTDGCWNWTAAIGDHGYGVIGVGPHSTGLAHRISYTWAHGPIPEGMQVDHKCFNRACVNPDHLRLASQKQNKENHRGARRDSKSGIRGVHWDASRNRWIAQLSHLGVQMHVGTFRDAASAEAAVIAKRNELHTHNDMDRVVA